MIYKINKQIISTVIVLILLSVFVYWTKPFDTIRTINQISIKYLLIAIIFSILSHVTLGIRYWFGLRTSNPNYKLKTSILVHFITPILARITPANLGETKKIFNKNLDFKEASFIHLNERIIDFMILFIIGLGIFVLLDIFDELIYSFLFIFLILILFSIIIYRIDTFVNFINLKTPFNITLEKNWYRKQLDSFELTSKIIFLILSATIWLSTMTVYFLIANTAEIDIHFIELSIIISAVVVIVSSSGLPGGYGIREIGLTFILVRFMIPLNVSTVFVILISLYFLVIEILFAVLAYLSNLFLKLDI